MKPVTSNAAKAFVPSSADAAQAAARYVDRFTDWSSRMEASNNALRDYVRTYAGNPRGVISQDPFDMSACGLVFDTPPSAGFIAVPGRVADDLRAKGVRGEAYIPDVTHPIGKQVQALLKDVSRVAEQRPLLHDVPGVAAAVVENNRLVLTRAHRTEDGGVVIKAAATAVAPAAHARLATTAESAAAPSATQAERTQTRKPRM